MRAIVLSLALHALVLGGLTKGLEFEAGDLATAERLHAVLRSVPEAALSHAVPPAPTFNKAPLRQMAIVPREPVAPAISKHEADSANTDPPAPTIHETPMPASSGGESMQRTTAKPASVALAAPVEVRGPDAAGLRQYRLALAGEARRFRRYPDAARREGITGTAEVRVTVAAAGAARHAELAHSSGHAVLDAAALDMLRQATARALLPESLRGQDFAVLLPVVFEVEQ